MSIRCMPRASLGQLGWLLLMAAPLAFAVSLFHPRDRRDSLPADSETIGSATIQQLPRERRLFIDARDDAAFARGHHPDALSLNPQNWTNQIAKLYDRWEPGMTVIVYARPRTEMAREIAHRLRAEAQLTPTLVWPGVWEELP